MFKIIILLPLLCLLDQLQAQDPKVSIPQTDPPVDPGTNQITAERDRDITLDCYVENLLDNVVVRWQRLTIGSDGREITKAISQDMAMDDNIHYSIEKPTQFTWRLRIRRIQVSDEGTYMCFVQVTLSSRVYATKVVSVFYYPTIDLDRTTGDKTLQAGDDIDLVCNATARPDPTIEWSRLGGSLLPIGQERFRPLFPLPWGKRALPSMPTKNYGHANVVYFLNARCQSGRKSIVLPTGRQLFNIVLQGQRGVTLKLSKVKPDDRGIYRCTAKNQKGSAFHDTLLDVQFAPVITVPRAEILQAVAYRAELQCLIEASPFPKIDTELTWTKDSKMFRLSSNRYEVNSIMGAFNRMEYELIIYSVTPEDYGTYSCRATNRIGPSSGKIVLKQTQTPQPSVKLGRIISGCERMAYSNINITLLAVILLSFHSIYFY